MSFSDHKITQFTHKITDLPDQPNLPADELKARFDSSPEELRQSVNGICDDADRLESRVSGIIAETFGDTIDKSMLSDELAAELDGKADADDVTAETQSLDARLDTVETALPQKCEVYFGTYEGDGEESQTITLEFAPKWILIFDISGYGGTSYSGGLAFQNAPCQNGQLKIITLNGNKLTVYNTSYGNTWARTNFRSTFYYIAGK